MTHGSLFSGIGGFDLASEWMGWDNKFHCEWEDFPRKVLDYHFPKSISYGDIKQTDFTIWRGRIDILTGGFPCQPYSTAGKRLGKKDERHLFPEMLRAVQEIKPRWIVGENVRGLVNWNEGLVFEEVQADLEAEGYKVQSFLLPACGVGAPHRRDRIWFVAFKDSNKNGWGSIEWKEESEERRLRNISTRDNERIQANNEQARIIAYPDGSIKRDRSGKNTQEEREVWGHEESDVSRKLSSDGNASDPTRYDIKNNWEQFPTQSPVCGGNDGIPRKLDSITFPKWRKESIKAYGNAIVPQVVLQIFKAIGEYEFQSKRS